MTTENVVVELVTPSDHPSQAGYGVKSTRITQVTAGAGTVAIDGVTYTRTSPLRTTHLQGEVAPGLDALLAQDAATFQAPVTGNASQGNQYTTPLPIFSQSGT